MKSVMKHQFSQVPKAQIQRSSFDRSSGCKTTFDAGQLIPFFLDEALPGDTFNLRTAGFARLATPIYPIMDNMYLETFYFAVPMRLVWDNFQKMMGEQEDPGDSTDYLIPQMESPPVTGYDEESLYDYFGIPTKVPDLSHSALPIRAYNLIFNEWFRDQNLKNSVPVYKNDGPDPVIAGDGLNRRGKRHDYFTSCLPWPQKGPDVILPLGDQAPVQAQGLGATNPLTINHTGTTDWHLLEPFGTTVYPNLLPNGANVNPMYADLSNATAVTINQIRESFQVQKMYERDARGGTRYTELIKSHFRVTSPDARLQRPEYLGGGSTPVNISPLASTAGSDLSGDIRNLADLSAVGTAAFDGHGFTKSFTEHSIIIGLLNVRADLTYQQGLNRMWSRLDRFDHYWPSFAGLGEQEVKNKEIYAQGSADPDADEATFGYQERYAEYRYKPSTIHGRFRSNSAVPLDAWHLSEDFASLPTLNATFINEKPPIDRVIAVPDEPQFIADFYHKLITARPMPLYGVPGNMDRF